MNAKPFILQTYKKEAAFSYAAGAFAVFELLRAKPELARAVYIRPGFSDAAKLTELCLKHGVPVYEGEKYFARVNQKENAYALGVFEKRTDSLSAACPHILLINPDDCGNIGAAVRTAAGLGFSDLAVVRPCGDVFHPKTVRASMGSLFHLRLGLFESFDEYRAAYPGHFLYPFMSGGAVSLNNAGAYVKQPFTLIFGNEGAGLDASFYGVGVSVRIPQSDKVDSLNLAVAVGIGAYYFAHSKPPLPSSDS